MPFPPSVSNEVLVAAGRHCCICRRFAGTKINLHHIIPEAKGGPNTFDNCAPLCFGCHADVGHYNDNHPLGKKYSPTEIRRHRDEWFGRVRERGPSAEAPSETRLASIEPYKEVVRVALTRGHIEELRFAVVIRNRGGKTIFIDEMGFLDGEKRSPGVFTTNDGKSREQARTIEAGRSQTFIFWDLKIKASNQLSADGLYVVLGSGERFSCGLDAEHFEGLGPIIESKR